MKKPVIVANWKANKTVEETQQWFQALFQEGALPSDHVIICPPFSALSTAKTIISSSSLPLMLGAQDISSYPNGAYTGEVTGAMLSGLVTYVIIGHSERRHLFHETDEILANKVQQAINAKLIPIFCVPDATTPIPATVQIVAYEPVFAIGSGTPDSPENAAEVARKIKENHMGITLLYGGSVKADNIISFVDRDTIDGVLVGGASLDAHTFYELIQRTISNPTASTVPAS